VFISVLFCVLVIPCIYNISPLPFSFQLLIPVSGSKAAGYLRTKATFQFGRWELDSVVLEFRGRPQTLTIVDNKESRVT